MRLFFFVSILFFSIPCKAFRPKIDSVYETYDEIKISFNKSKYKYYTLYNNYGREVSSAKSSGYSLKFTLPNNHKFSKSECLYVENDKGKVIKFEDEYITGFLPKLANKYLENSKYLVDNINEIAIVKNEVKGLSDKYFLRQSILKKNKAYFNQSCSMPLRKSYPLKPDSAKCESEYDCSNEAEQLCILKVGGAVGCSELAQEHGYSASQVSALCSLAFADYLKQKYTIEEAIFDTVVGLVDDAGDSGLESDSLFWNIIGVGLKATAVLTKVEQYKSCKRSYTRKFYKPYRNWRESIRLIDNEPGELYQECENNNSKKNKLFQSISSKKSYLSELETINSSMIKSLDGIKEKRLRLYPSCSP